MSYIGGGRGGRGAEEGASLSVVTESEGFLCRVVKGHGVPVLVFLFLLPGAPLALRCLPVIPSLSPFPSYSPPNSFLILPCEINFK